MQIHLSPRHVTLTAALHGYVAEKVAHLEEIASDILAAHVVLVHDETKSLAKAFTVKIHLAVPGPDIHVEQPNRDLFAAIDLATSKLARQLRKRKTKRVDKGKSKIQRAREAKKLYGS